MQEKMSIDHEFLAESSHKGHQTNSGDFAQENFLGLDFGLSKIGLAIADGETKMAFALDTLANDGSFLDGLKEIVAQKNIETIVIGMTAHQKDEKSVEEKIAFAKMLEKELAVKIVFQEEMFSTKMAQANIKLRGGKNIAKTDDQEAARIILQSWLDANQIL